MFSSKIFTLISGMISALVFAPIFFIPGLFALALLCYQVQIANSWKEASILGFIFGYGHFLVSMYWISIGVTVYIDEFWWAVPLALFGLPIILACFIATTCGFGFLAKSHHFYQFIFCLYWVFFEWVRSWIFTGLPWNLLGYAFSFSDILIQSSSIIGIYGLSFIVIYISTSFYHIFTKQYNLLKILLANSLVIIALITSYGLLKLHNNPTSFSNIKVRLVQPSIPQIAKWDVEEFWKNFNLHIALSKEPGNVDLIIWSEAAMVAPHDYQPIKIKILKMLKIKKAILITGGITNNGKNGEDFEIYTSLYALTEVGNKLFEYHKSHLVPFGEYMPLKWLLPFKKLTAGLLDYTAGDRQLVSLDKPNITIKPLICYESIFPNFVRTSNKLSDVIINVTNDAWYGNSTGSYQHLQISRMRSVENGLPMLRTANNGISAVIDPVGRIIQQRHINEVGYIDNLLPNKLKFETLYSQFGDICALLAIITTLISYILIKNIININKKLLD
ncbi:apolipoprotein N-acyltransferase [Candidatus Tisiphia endosymbiont of Psammoecus bipunctatus]|uniref:apolipoprotein N-acyltransferase n=1 Tax=Candidatus Tisiphia endosymbiont of Psammoecus bipunctatus TaxID=3139333 RepID=UPI0035C8812A